MSNAVQEPGQGEDARFLFHLATSMRYSRIPVISNADECKAPTFLNDLCSHHLSTASRPQAAFSSSPNCHHH